jgi:hypothetical protein
VWVRQSRAHHAHVCDVLTREVPARPRARPARPAQHAHRQPGLLQRTRRRQSGDARATHQYAHAELGSEG